MNNALRMIWPLSLAIAVGGMARAAEDRPMPAPNSPPVVRPEVVSVYYPHWHSYDHGSYTPNDPPTATDWQVLADKMNELITALRR